MFDLLKNREAAKTQSRMLFLAAEPQRNKAPKNRKNTFLFSVFLKRCAKTLRAFAASRFKARPYLFAVTLVLFFSLPAPHARAMGLKENSVVTGNTITLGDIFYGLPRDEDRVLGSAPRPGDDMVLNARTLLRIAVSLDLPWRPSSSTDHVVLRREATVIGHDRIKSSIKSALAGEGLSGTYDISLPPEQTDIILPRDQPATLEVSRLSLDRAKNSFDVTLAAPSKENPIQQINVRGRIHPLVLVPVLKDNIQNGRVIRDSDIDYIEVQEGRFISGTVIDEQALIGMTPRRMAFAGRPLQENDIIAPQIVSRGEFITVTLDDGPLSLTAQGKALENGAKGDIIRVLNTASNVTLQAVVTGEKQVRVAAD